MEPVNLSMVQDQLDQVFVVKFPPVGFGHRPGLPRSQWDSQAPCACEATELVIHMWFVFMPIFYRRVTSWWF